MEIAGIGADSQRRPLPAALHYYLVLHKTWPFLILDCNSAKSRPILIISALPQPENEREKQVNVEMYASAIIG